MDLQWKGSERKFGRTGNKTWLEQKSLRLSLMDTDAAPSLGWTEVVEQNGELSETTSFWEGNEAAV